MAELQYADVATLLKADFEQGKLFWLPRTSALFDNAKGAAETACKRWNLRYAGREAFTADDSSGYLMGRIFDRPYKAHRVIWMLAHKQWPAESIDHINGDKKDNRLENLRSVNHAANMRNLPIKSNNTSGVVGVSWDSRAGKWYASIAIDGKTRNLGQFTDFDDAVAARKSAEAQFEFHPNHGRGGIIIGSTVIRRRC